MLTGACYGCADHTYPARDSRRVWAPYGITVAALACLVVLREYVASVGRCRFGDGLVSRTIFGFVRVHAATPDLTYIHTKAVAAHKATTEQ